MSRKRLKGDGTLSARLTDNNTTLTHHHRSTRRILFASIAIMLCGCSQLPWQAQQQQTEVDEQAPTEPDTQDLSYTSIDEITAQDDGSANAQAIWQCVPESGVAWMEPGHDDLWARIRHGFQLNLNFDNPRISAELAWFGAHQKYIDRVTDRSAPYLHYIVQELERYNVPMELALLPVVESSYDPFAYSHGNASGMWQFISSTGELYGLRQNWWYDGRRDVRESTRAAIQYLSHLAKHYRGDWELALAAYNTGQGNVDRAIRRNIKKGLPTDYWSLKLPKETSAYVPRLLAVARIVADPAAHGVALNAVPNTPYFEAVNIGSQIDLAEAAHMADISIQEMYQLNPAFNRWATDPRGPFELLVPARNAPLFRAQLAEQANGNQVSWQQYQIVTGDSLSLIAKRHHTSVATIAQANQLNSHVIHAGNTLLIPLVNGPLTGTKPSNPKPRRVNYYVRKGDSLWNIASRYKVSEKQVRSWNKLADDAPIIAGSTLVLWPPQPYPTAANNALNNPLPAPYIRKVGYTVRNGDTLHEIASKFSVKLTDIRKWNPGQQSGLAPGQRLTLYVDITKAR